MTLTELRYIVAVAREKHFGRAAASCHVSQPTLSVAVKKLEDELGTLIFERHQHEVGVTPLGRQIIEQAQRVLEQAQAIRLIAEQGRGQLQGEVRLGAIYTIGPYLLPKLIPILQQRAPELNLVIDEDFTANLSAKLRHGELDLIIVSTPFEAPGVSVQVSYEEPFVAAFPKGHALGKRRQLRTEDLAGETLLLLRAGNCFREQVMAACPACRADAFTRSPMQKTLESSSLETIRQMVAAGSGVTVLPATAAQGRDGITRLLEYRPFAKPVPKREVALAWRVSYPRGKVVDLVRSSIRACNLADVEFRS
jgi:LysR family hydrogen peroxide-inducible transcriptional activator